MTIPEVVTTHPFTTPWGDVVVASARQHTSDYNTHLSSITEDEYRLALLPKPDGSRPFVALDIGAHIGSEALVLQRMGYHVVSVEPLPENQELYATNMRTNMFVDWELIQGALGAGSGGSLEIWYGPHELDPEHRYIGVTAHEGRGTPITVSVVDLEELLKPHDRVDFLKIDIEGAEWEPFTVLRRYKSRHDQLRKVDRIAVELGGADGHQAVSTGDFLDLLPDCFVDVSEQVFPDWCAPSPQVHGYYVNTRVVDPLTPVWV